MTREEERAVIERVLAGDGQAFEALVKANEKGVYNLALRMLGNAEDALDASQEAFFRAYKALGRFRGDSKFSVWLYRLTSNVCLDMLRRAGRYDETSLTGEDEEDLPLPDSRFFPGQLSVMLRHDTDQFLITGFLRIPSQNSFCFRGISP